MEGLTHPSDADREFDELRRRAYGPDPDIGVDPPALARLRELEAAHRADIERRTDVPASRNAAGTDVALAAAPADAASAGDTKPWWSRLAWAGGALVVAGGIVATTLLVSGPRPAATLHPTAAEADNEVRRLVDEEAHHVFRIDTSTLRPYGSYLGFKIWSGVNAFESPCLVAVHQASDSLSELRCTPPPADLIMDVSSSDDGFKGFDGLDRDGIIRFMFRGDTVDAYLYLMPEAG